MTSEAKNITASLLHRAQAGDKSAEKDLFTHLSARFALIVRQKVRYAEDRQDIVQGALALIAKSYREVEIQVSFAAWARTILHHEITDYYRSSERRYMVNVDDVDSGFHTDEQVDPMLKRNLLDCLKKVNLANRRHARMLILRYMGFEFSEICLKLNLKRNNAYSVLNRARTMLEECLKKKRYNI